MDPVSINTSSSVSKSLDKSPDTQVRRIEVQEVYSKTIQKTVEETKAAKPERITAAEFAELQKASEALNKFMDEKSNRSVRFSTDEPTGKTVISIVDRQTGEQLKQFPPQEFLDMVAALNRAASIVLKDLPKFI